MSYSKPKFKASYGNFINGKFVEPLGGDYFDNTSPIDGSHIAKYPRSQKEDVEMAIDAANAAKDNWEKTSVTERAALLNKVADIIDENLEEFATVETCDNGKAIRETLNADVPLSADHWRYFASCIRAEEGSVAELDEHTLSMNIKEPLGVVGQIIPWNFPLLMLSWKLPPALAAGNCVVLKPAEQTPSAATLLMEKIADVFPPGVVNVIHGFGPEAGKPLASSSKIDKVAFTGETTTGQLIMQYASKNLNPVTVELGGKSPNVFFNSVMDEDDAFLDKCIEGAVLFAFNQGEVCTCPSRMLVQEDIYDKFMERVVERTKAIVQSNPYDVNTQVGAQASNDQYEKIQSYLKIGKEEGAKTLCGGEANKDGDLSKGHYIKPTILEGHNKMRVFQEEIFGPVVCVTKFKDEAEALEIANDTLYGLGAGVWTRDAHQLYQIPRAIKAGRVWVNCYHAYPAHAAFGGYKKSGFGRENHLMMLSHYRQNKNMLISYDKNKLGFF
ncbi:aldehyde dehydrogenase family protein [Mesohalobacter halotolerans]|uniref:Aldehyde dehydrogenase n=1 Tax=Mesohalobacter halotolerans TaxID=1883405 RepID=A0A4U5TQQ9_9FLAO|nr:aldehyde dehydrogenase family protein [Mesohalobacter halotolerans]MBS3737753.1 aldehyde dehydrogenase [Psychroflexus sp.]TKS56550.1 aldehyde dehydrogenase [Mesohalobacter halotolerans]